MAEATIDADKAARRIKQLYDDWKANKDTTWENADALAVIVGGPSEDLRYLKSISLQLWMLGYELPDTAMLFTPTEVHIVTSGKKASVIQPIVSACSEVAGVTVVMHTRGKQEDGSTQLGQLITAVRALGDAPVLGHLPKDKHEGKFAGVWESTLAASGLATADISAGVGGLLSVKEGPDLLNIKKSAFLAASVMANFVVPRMEDIVDKERKVKHAKLSEMTEEVITEPQKANIRLKAENVDIAYPPSFQSGGNYDLKYYSALPDDSTLHDGVVLVSLGTRYSQYCANVGRTYLFNSTKKQEAEYKALLAAHDAAIRALVPGARMSAALEAAVESLKASGQQEMVAKMGKTLGAGIGLDFRESNNVLNAKNEGVVRAGMTFNVVLGVQGLDNPEAKDGRGRTYALQIADTVVVQEGGNELATDKAPRDLAKISYSLEDKDGDEEEEDDLGAGAAAEARALADVNGLHAKKTTRHDDPNFKSAEAQRKEKQEELLRLKNEETLRRLTAQQGGGAEASTSGRRVSQIVAYRGVQALPPVRDLVIHVDDRAESVLLPVYGVMVPFHITTIKTVTSNQDNDHAHIRLSFNFAGAYEPASTFPDRIFLKELSFRSADVKHATKVVQEIKLLRSKVLQRDKENAERATLVEQEKLVRGKRVFRLPDLWIRPALGSGRQGRKQPGVLEAHANGFRYSNPKGEVLDIMYRNIKHAFFQPAENEMITILHFHLINPIMVANKKTKDVQCYAEVMESVQTLDTGKRSMYDPDEIEEEQREREKRNKVNAEFQQFVRRVQELWEKDFAELQLEFDIPFRELGFQGVPARSTVFVIPTVNCLVELTETPFTVVSLEDIEIVNLERVGFNLKNFDMAIVFKDFDRDVLRIDAIPAKQLDTIKEWLTSVKIKYYESKMNLAWKPVLKHIKEFPHEFVENGGWDFLNVDKSDSEDENEEEVSEDFKPEESEEESSDDDDASDDESLVDEEESSGEDEDESEGKDWDELEEEARNQDKAREGDDSDDERAARKRKGGGGGGSGGGGGGPQAKRRK